MTLEEDCKSTLEMKRGEGENKMKICFYILIHNKNVIKSFFQIQNTIRLSYDCRFDRNLNSPNHHMKIKTKNTKNGVTSTINLALHKDLILKTPRREFRLGWWKWRMLHMERHYEGSHFLFLNSRAQYMS